MFTLVLNVYLIVNEGGKEEQIIMTFLRGANKVKGSQE